MLNATEKLIGNLDSVYDIITGLEKIDQLLQSPIEKEGRQELVSQQDGVQLEMVNFGLHFEEKGYLFKEVSLDLPKNTCIGIYGKEGSGKTTLLNVLNGNLLDFEGNYLIDKVPIQKYELDKLRGQIGNYVYPADIFKGSLFENISMMRQGIENQDISSLIQEVGFNDFMEHFEDGFDTPLDIGGRKLATNIRKKILLLRAFINNPRLIILDEPFAGLSDLAKEMLKNYLLKKASESTIVIATNDKKSIGFCEIKYQIRNTHIERIEHEK
jgi:ABC-type bacteriocin/lantibiotic exporter with double-glycine peptidase domain